MCGIAGVIRRDTHPIDRESLLSIREAMRERGPDGAGLWVSRDQEVGLAQRRLAIIDLSDAGLQPMESADKRFCIVFNGEIYNYQTLREEMVSHGWKFRSSSDTEVLIALYSRYGQKMLGKLRGMYAFAIWDELKKVLFVARDPLGIKPLYYSHSNKVFQFASQVKALLCGENIDTRPCAAGRVGFLLWGSVPSPFTLYEGIRELPAGHCLTLSPQRQEVSPQPFWTLSESLTASDIPPGRRDQIIWLKEVLADTVRHHLIADVPVGVFLSSGIDSTAILTLASQQLQKPIQAHTLAFSEYKGTPQDEVPLAQKIAKGIGAAHSVTYITKQQFVAEYETILTKMDQPSIDGLNTYFISKVVADAGLKVALSGLGADEIFGGYPGFTGIPSLVSKIRPFSWIPGLGKGFRWISAGICKRYSSPKYSGLLEYGGDFGGAYLLRRGLFMPWELFDHLDPDVVVKGLQDLQTIPQLTKIHQSYDDSFRKVAALELSMYMRNQLLRDSDWASMAHSLELRVPFVDIHVVSKVLSAVSSNWHLTKKIMVQCLESSVATELINRPKSGFSVPVREWIGDMYSNPMRGLRGWALHLMEKHDANS